MKFILPLLLLLSATARAEPILGYDALGLAMYCKTYMASPALPAVSVLMNTFGDPLKCLDKVVPRGTLRLVQVDLIDATCWRNKNCPAGVPKPDDTRVIKARAQKVNKLAVKYPSVEWWVSPALEHDIKDKAKVKKMMDAAQAGCPTCKVINSPYSGAKTEPLELHGTKVRAFSVSGDGASSFDADNISSDFNNFQHNRSGNYTTFLWWNELNLRCTGEKKFTPPLNRTEKPTKDQFMQAYRIAQDEQPVPPAPAVCTSVVRLDSQKGEIYKPNAESYCNGVAKDSRSNKPMLIINKKGKRGDKIKVYSSVGKESGCFAYYGTYENGPLHRWYMGSCSGHTASKLYDSQGGEWGYTHLGKGKCLLTNSVRRLGKYR